MKLFQLGACLALLLLCGCGAEADDQHAIDKAYYEWAAAADAKDLDRWDDFLAPDAVFMPPDSAALKTREEILDFHQALFADPAFSGISCKQEMIEIAASGDLAWSAGYCDFDIITEDGGIIGKRSKWTKVWEKQPDGSWKGKLNMWNSDPS